VKTFYKNNTNTFTKTVSRLFVSCKKLLHPLKMIWMQHSLRRRALCTACRERPKAWATRRTLFLGFSSNACRILSSSSTHIPICILPAYCSVRNTDPVSRNCRTMLSTTRWCRNDSASSVFYHKTAKPRKFINAFCRNCIIIIALKLQKIALQTCT